MHRSVSQRSSRRAYTLIELLVVVTVLGIAATMVVPAFSQTNTLRLQAAVRLIVSDLSQAQSDAVAMQAPQGVRFRNTSQASSYIIGPIVNGEVDASPGMGVTRIISGDEFGHAHFGTISLSDGGVYFDALGGPVTTPNGQTPAGNQSIDVVAGVQSYRILIEAYTGRITVEALEDLAEIIIGD